MIVFVSDKKIDTFKMHSAAKRYIESADALMCNYKINGAILAVVLYNLAIEIMYKEIYILFQHREADRFDKKEINTHSLTDLYIQAFANREEMKKQYLNRFENLTEDELKKIFETYEFSYMDIRYDYEIKKDPKDNYIEKVLIKFEDLKRVARITESFIHECIYSE